MSVLEAIIEGSAARTFRTEPLAAPGQADEPQRDPLIVDMDDTLLRTDTLIESVLMLVALRPWEAVLPPIWLWRGGRAGLKRSLAEHVTLAVDTLPVNEKVLAWLRDEHAGGRALHLVSAADQSVVERVAGRFGIFDSALGSDGRVNLSGAEKLAAIRGLVGPRFSYAGDSRRDLPVWEGGGTAVLVGNLGALRPVLPPHVAIERTFPSDPADWQVWARALRLHQWSKNLLLFVALLLGGDVARDFPVAVAGFVVFGLMASATYLLNDMLDLPHDRLHRSKRRRPFASGTLPLKAGFVAVGALGAAACLLLVWLPFDFALATGLYFVTTLAYSLHVKRRLMLDVFTLAVLFTIRIGAGIVAVQHPVSPWLLAFSMFFFLSLACVKRYGECLAMSGDGVAPGRAYRPVDAPWLMSMGAAAAFSAMSTFFLFLIESGSPILMYPHPRWMWLICIILGYWLCRTWALTTRGQMNDDPVLFALRDRLSLTLAGVIAVLVLLARG